VPQVSAKKKKPSNKLSQSALFHKAQQKFIYNLESLKQFYKAVHPVVYQIDKTTEEEFVKHLEKIVGPLGKKAKRTRNLEAKKIDQIVRLIEDKKPTYNVDILYQNIVITLCSYFEILVCDIARIYYAATQESIFDDAEIKYSEIKNFRSIRDITEHLIGKKVFDMTHGSFGDWLKFFSQDIKVDVKKLVDLYNDPLVELFQRRHLYIHNGGIVNQNYLKTVDQHYLKTLGGEIKDKNPIKTTTTYLDNSLRYIEVFGLLLANCLWHKMSKKNETASELKGRESAMLVHSFNLIKREEYTTAEELIKLAIGNFKYTEFYSLALKVNYWQSLKWQNKLDSKIKQDIEQLELGTKNNLFKLAVYALLDNDKAFFETIPLALRGKDITKEDLVEWPIFKEMRKDQRFAKFLKLGRKIKKGANKKA
jgi:hypothetical protein